MPKEEYDPRGGGIVFTPTIDEDTIIEREKIKNKMIKLSRESRVNNKELFLLNKQLEDKLDEFSKRLAKIEEKLNKMK